MATPTLATAAPPVKPLARSHRSPLPPDENEVPRGGLGNCRPYLPSPLPAEGPPITRPYLEAIRGPLAHLPPPPRQDPPGGPSGGQGPPPPAPTGEYSLKS